MELYHGSSGIVEYPDIRRSRNTKDFSWGFYCTNKQKQAERWTGKWIGTTKKPTLNVYEYTENSNLKILRFNDMSNEWLDFVAQCRIGIDHDYDIVEGPMADDVVWNFVNGYLSGDIPRTVFMEYAKFNRATHQISFHTLKALGCLKFVRSEEVK